MSRWLFTALVLLAVGIGACSDDETDSGPWDLLVTGGTVVDGSGAPGVRADVAVREGQIVRVSSQPLPRELATGVIEAEGKVVAPGFIDMHAHLDPLLELPGAESHVRQGVTTALGGPDGSAPWPLGTYLDSAATLGVGMNVAFLAGHNTIRREVMGTEARAPSPAELCRMEVMVARAMGEGAWGLSTGLRYVPGTYSEIGEVVALARVASDSGGIYTSHLREEGLDLLEGVAELIEIARRADIRAILTHHKVVGFPMWGSSERTLALVDSARDQGLDVRIDQYPYTATYTGISILLPPWSLAGGDSAFARRVRDPVLRDSIVTETVFNIVNDRGGNDLRRVQLALVPWMPELEGQTLYDWAVARGLEPTPETGAELVIEAMERGGASAIYHALDEGDLERIMRHPQTMIASDGRLTRPGLGHPHPRWYGTFPRVLGRYVREEGVLTLEEAVRKMTSMPASAIGLTDRGVIAEGMVADLVVFDPETVEDRATFEDPHQYPEGIDFVVVNGVVTVDGGRHLDVRPGRVLRRGMGRTDFSPLPTCPDDPPREPTVERPIPVDTAPAVPPPSEREPDPRPDPRVEPPPDPNSAPAPEPTADLAPVNGSGIWISRDEIARLPTSGRAWANVRSEANGSCGRVDLRDQNQRNNVCILAKALVFARTGQERYRADVLRAVGEIVTARPYRGEALSLGRELGAYVIAADLIGLSGHDPALDARFRSALRTLRTTPTTGAARDLIDCHERRPNNWGAHCGATRAAIAIYLGDDRDLERAARVFRGYLGDRSAYSDFRYGGPAAENDLTWQCDPDRPVGINPVGCARDGLSLDGVLPDDQRRGGSFTTRPPRENYVWEALQGLVAQAVILHRAGYDVWAWEDRALLRAVRWLHEVMDFPAEGDDTWLPHVVNHYYGTDFPAPIPSRPGKNLGWTDWTHP